MAACEACDGVMSLVDGCTAVPYVQAYRYGSEPHFESGELEPRPRCSDCGARVGHHHHVNCLQARCSQCGDQAACCDHDVDG